MVYIMIQSKEKDLSILPPNVGTGVKGRDNIPTAQNFTWINNV